MSNSSIVASLHSDGLLILAIDYYDYLMIAVTTTKVVTAIVSNWKEHSEWVLEEKQPMQSNPAATSL